MDNATTVSYKENPNWIFKTDQPSEDTSVNIPVVVMLSVFSVVGIIGNAIAFYIFFGRRSTSTSVIFILALAGTDFITCLVTIPYTIILELLKYYLVYDVACKTYMFLITSTVPFSAYIMVGIALDRYFCICYPFLFVFTLPRAKAVISCMSIPAVMFGLITALSFGTYTYQWDIKARDSSGRFVHQTTTAQVGTEELNRYLAALNLTNATLERHIVPYNVCVSNTFIFNQDFLDVYKKIHALNFLVAYVAVAILYILIYKSIFTRRANKARRRKENNIYVSANSTFKDNQQEETQMTVINGSDCNSPTSVNKQTRKDAKSARKATLAARNDPSTCNKTNSQRVDTAGSDEKEDERMNLLDDNPEVWSNETTGNSTNVSTCNTTSTPGGMMSDCRDLQEDDGCSVYIGPQTYIKKLSPHEILKSDNGKSKDVIGGEPGNYDYSVPDSSFNSNLLENITTSECGFMKVTDSDKRNDVSSPTSEIPEEKPLISRCPLSPATPPNSLALASNMSKMIASQSEDRESVARRQPAVKHSQSDTQANSLKRKRHGTVRDKTLMANMKTAFMLFIVTLVFIIAFLPALLMANGLIPLNLIGFYGYFIYNVANPFIYAFMNQTFREDLKKIISVCRRRTS